MRIYCYESIKFKIMNTSVLKRMSRIFLIALVLASVAGTTGCKKKKELAAAEAAKAAQLAADIAKAKEILQSILDDNTLDHVDENYQKLDEVKAMNLEDPEVLNMIITVQEKLAKDKEALARKLEEERLAAEAERLRLEAEKRKKENYDLLNKQFAALAGEQDFDKANTIINNVLPMFASKDVPVLIIIAEENGMKDYDRTTTIEKYLNYLKDRKAYKATVDNIVYDENGKIKELELRKTY